MPERFAPAMPTPRDLAARAARPQVLDRPAPAPVPPPAPTVGHGWSREAYEVAVRFSEMHPNARLVAFILAHFADPDTGVIAAARVPELRNLARAAGINDTKARYSLTALTHREFIVREPYDTDRQLHGAISLTIPAGRPQPRAR